MMNWIKIILALVGMFLAFWVAMSIIGLVMGIIWFVFWIALLGAIGYGGYKLFFEKDRQTQRLEDRTPMQIADMNSVDRELEEVKRKYLPK